MQPPTLQKELLQVSFLGIFRTATLPHNFWTARKRKSVIIHYYKKMKQRFSTKKNYKKLIQTQREKSVGQFENKSENVKIANIN